VVRCFCDDDSDDYDDDDADDDMQFGLYTILPLPIVYGAWHTRGGSGVDHALRDIVFEQNTGGEIKEVFRANNRID